MMQLPGFPPWNSTRPSTLSFYFTTSTRKARSKDPQQMRPSEFLPQHSTQNQSITSPSIQQYCAMLTSHPTRELAPFDGNPEIDVTDWLSTFERAFSVHRHAMLGTPEQILTAKASHLRSKLAEPAFGRITHELSRYHANAQDYHSLVTVMKRLYVNSASSELARSTLARMYQQPEESIATFSNRLSKCIDRSYPTQTSTQRETRKLEEFTVRILPSLRLGLYRVPLTEFNFVIF